MTKTLDIIAPIAIALAAIALVFAFFQAQDTTFASVESGQEYMATTTYAAHPDADGVRYLKTGYGALAQVTITGDNTGLISLYNATTSDISLRAASKATSTILIADFPASAPEGTYVFDATFTDGLLLVVSGAEATSSIMYR